MRIGVARAAAVDWVLGQARADPGYRGAFFTGSTVGRPADDDLPPHSDVDLAIVTEADQPPSKLGKFHHRGVLLEVTYLALAELASAERVLSSFYLAGSFRADTVIDDPTGHLGMLRTAVSRDFAEPGWVRRRCAHAQTRIERGLRGIDPAAMLADQVTPWLFGTSTTTLLPLLAALRNPTVRLRYLAAGTVLADYGHDTVHRDLLHLLGCAELTGRGVRRQVDELARTFDVAATVARTPFFFSSDITPAARHIAIDGSHRLIDGGCHREAVFWIIATFARCHQILAVDAPELERAHRPAFASALAELGINSVRDMLRRAEDTLAYLPRLWATVDAILAAGPR